MNAVGLPEDHPTLESLTKDREFLQDLKQKLFTVSEMLVKAKAVNAEPIVFRLLVIQQRILKFYDKLEKQILQSAQCLELEGHLIKLKQTLRWLEMQDPEHPDPSYIPEPDNLN